jgi:hypothetical protein
VSSEWTAAATKPPTTTARRPPLPKNTLTYPNDHRSGIVGLSGCADHRSDITVHPGLPSTLYVSLNTGMSQC